MVDDSGTPLPGVGVSATSPAQIGGVQLTQTDEQGRFFYPRLAPGVYVVRLALDGFITQELIEVQVRLDRTTDLQVVLPPAGFGDTVDVVETTPVVDPRQVSTGQVFTSEYLQSAALGMDDRHYISLLSQTAGVGHGGLFGVSVLGSTRFENVYLIDGSDTTDPYDQLAGVGTLSFEAANEVPAEYRLLARLGIVVRLLAEQSSIGKVLRPPRCEFVGYKLPAPQNRDAKALDLGLDRRILSLFERDAADRRHEVDPSRRQAQLIDRAGVLEVPRSDAMALDRRAEVPEREHEACCVLCIRRHEDVQVTGGSRDSMDRESMGSDDQEADASLL